MRERESRESRESATEHGMREAGKRERDICSIGLAMSVGKRYEVNGTIMEK